MTSPTEANAIEYFKAQLDSWGLSGLYNDALSMMQQGYDQDTITLRLQQTDAYKQRFKANDIRKQKGLAVLSPAEYIATENQYATVMRQAGLPSGFYDSQDDFTNFLGNDVSPAEMQNRVDVAAKQWMNVPQDQKDIWRSYYGYTDGDAIASILDPNMSLPLLEQRSNAVQIGTAAERNGFTQPTASRAEFLAQAGLTAQQAQQGYSQIGQTFGAAQSMAGRFGTSFDQTDAENATLLGQADAVRKQKTLAANEQTAFNGNASSSEKTLSASSNF